MTREFPARTSYRDQFDNADSASRYDAVEYGPRSWATLLWSVEQAALSEILAAPNFVPRRERYLDFACGSGRVTRFLSPQFMTTVGVDITDSMLDLARRQVPDATFVQADVGTEPERPGADFDLITAFRFLLNADPEDRVPALRWMRSRLRDGASRAIVNNHGNLWTHKAIPHAIRRFQSRGREPSGNVLSHREMIRLITEAGLAVESVHGMGLLGGSALKIIPFRTMERLQQALRGTPLLERLGEDQLYVLARS